MAPRSKALKFSASKGTKESTTRLAPTQTSAVSAPCLPPARDATEESTIAKRSARRQTVKRKRLLPDLFLKTAYSSLIAENPGEGVTNRRRARPRSLEKRPTPMYDCLALPNEQCESQQEDRPSGGVGT
ncbi:hypothetical protein AB1Y20_011059 [Prymnesium parvum]|uniref:Uncharacterized protein n=1 Tax=Prymnesium parvum TaxID=97485 RepID=A0AB34INE0_PRYPA